MAHISEEKVTVTYSNGVPTYAVKIKDFQNKMKTWPNGKRTISEVFSVDGVDLCLIIYPNGDGKKNEGNVSVFLENKSFDTIRVEYVLKMKDVEMSITKDNWKPKPDSASTWGFPTFYCHKGVTEVGTDEKTKIRLTVKSVKKEVSNLALLSSIGTEIQRRSDQLRTNIQSSINNCTNQLKRKYESIETKMEAESSNFEKRIANLESRLESRLEASTESIKMKIEDNTNKNNNIAKPRCPICFDEMSPNTKIAQCISGHLLCWSCKEKMEDKECAFCEEPVNGRAFGMEAYLKTIFG